MVARREIRRRNFEAAYFLNTGGSDGGAKQPCSDGRVVLNDIAFEVLVAGPSQDDLPVAHRLVKLFDGDDEPILSPWHVVLRDAEAEGVFEETQRELEITPLFIRVETNHEFDTGYEREDLDRLFADVVGESDDHVVRARVYRRAGQIENIDVVEATTDLLRLVSTVNERLAGEDSPMVTSVCPCCGAEVEIAKSISPSAASPIYGLLSSQRTHPSEDVESTTSVTPPATTTSSRPARVTIIDTGLSATAGLEPADRRPTA